MEFYIEATNTSNIERAKSLYHLGNLYGYSFGNLKLASLTTNFDEKVKYIKKYHSKLISNEKLLDLVSFWFFLNPYDIIKNRFQNINLLKVWKERFFAKNIEFDRKLESKYKYYFDEFEDYEPTSFFEYIGLLILYDQISRNIFRGTTRAYKYDQKSYSLVKKLLHCYDKLPIVIQIMFVLVLIHQEDNNCQSKSKEIVSSLKNKVENPLFSKLMEIVKNHNLRIELFGRIPERNTILNRKSTQSEIIFMNSVSFI